MSSLPSTSKVRVNFENKNGPLRVGGALGPIKHFFIPLHVRTPEVPRTMIHAMTASRTVTAATISTCPADSARCDPQCLGANTLPVKGKSSPKCTGTESELGSSEETGRLALVGTRCCRHWRVTGICGGLAQPFQFYRAFRVHLFLCFLPI